MKSATYTLTETEHLAFWRLQFDSSLKRSAVVLGALIGILALIAYFVSTPSSAIGVIGGGVVGAAVMVVLSRFLLIPYQAKKVWRDYALIKEEMTLSLTDQGFKIDQASGHVDAKWSQMVSWNEGETVFAIYVNRQLAYLIPKGQVPVETLDFARERLVESGLAKRGARRK